MCYVENSSANQEQNVKAQHRAVKWQIYESCQFPNCTDMHGMPSSHPGCMYPVAALNASMFTGALIVSSVDEVAIRHRYGEKAVFYGAARGASILNSP
jgi:hypothetical protein